MNKKYGQWIIRENVRGGTEAAKILSEIKERIENIRKALQINNTRILERISDCRNIWWEMLGGRQIIVSTKEKFRFMGLEERVMLKGQYKSGLIKEVSMGTNTSFSLGPYAADEEIIR
jgi:hypothetical protein